VPAQPAVTAIRKHLDAKQRTHKSETRGEKAARATAELQRGCRDKDGARAQKSRGVWRARVVVEVEA